MILVRIFLLVIFNVFTCVGSVAITDINWSSKSERFSYRYRCNGSENNLKDCSKSLPLQYIYPWSNRGISGVNCQFNNAESKISTNVT